MPRWPMNLPGSSRLNCEPTEEQGPVSRALGIGTQLGPLSDPGVPDLAAAGVVDQHAEGVLPVAIGEGHGQRLVPTARVGVVPAVTDLRSADQAGPRGISHIMRADPRGRLA